MASRLTSKGRRKIQKGQAPKNSILWLGAPPLGKEAPRSGKLLPCTCPAYELQRASTNCCSCVCHELKSLRNKPALVCPYIKFENPLAYSRWANSNHSLPREKGVSHLMS